MVIRAWAAHEVRGKLVPFEYDPGPLGPSQVEIAVTHCGVCFSDLAMIENEWGVSKFPLVPGHEVIGSVSAVGAAVTHLRVGDRVGAGWYSGSCKTCEWCLGGDQNICPHAEGILVGRHGGFADRVRVDGLFAVPIPATLNAVTTAPLLCAGITVFNPFVQIPIRPTMRVGVIGIGGLGHLALRFAKAWGCRVVAFTGTGAKAAEARSFGADEVINSRDASEIDTAANSLDVILSTQTAHVEWNRYVACLRPRGTLVTLGGLVSDMQVSPLGLIAGQRSIMGSPSGSPATAAKMLNFAARHNIGAQVQSFPMRMCNEAMDFLRSNQARYRIVLTNGS